MLRVTQGPLLHDLSDNVVQPMRGYIAMSTGAQQLSLPLKNLRNNIDVTNLQEISPRVAQALDKKVCCHALTHSGHDPTD